MKPLRTLHYVMGTLLDCTLFDLPEPLGRDLLQQGVHEIRRLDQLLSRHDPDSALSRLNRQAGHGPVRVPGELWQLLKCCTTLCRRTGGRFDISAAAGKRSCTPDSALRLHADGWVELASGARLDLGGIGKGYAVDRLVTLFCQAGVSRAFVNFGESSLYMLGTPPDAQAWPIFVRALDPDAMLGVLSVKDCAISTSHSFGRGLAATDRHILDPHRGSPIQQPCMSTIIAPDATLAEALSTAVLVSGAAWRDLLARFPETEGLYVGSDGVPHYTAGLAQCFQPCTEVV